MRSYTFLHRRHTGFVIVFVTFAIQLSSGLSQNCTGEPCMYGICMNSENGSYSCYCIDGYTGINCEINWDDCWSDPCLNGGTCNDAVASYNCTCPDGFIGLNCEQKYSECVNQPCLNNGTCIDYNGFMCQCLEGYSGDYCEIDASVCNNTICKNAGECVEGPGFSFYCRCTEGWTGPFCDDDIDECVTSPCQNGGLCLNVPATYTCACLFGFTGKDCDKEIVPCDENPCRNEAMCLLEDSQPVCYCVPDYHGQLCEQRYDDCESKFARCENGGTCIDGINDFTCSCPVDYTGDMCDDYNPQARTTTVSGVETTGEANSSVKTVPLPTMIHLSSRDTTTESSITDDVRDETLDANLVTEEYSTTWTVLMSTLQNTLRNTTSFDDRDDDRSTFPTKTTTIASIDSDLWSITSPIVLSTSSKTVTSASGLDELSEAGLTADSTESRASTVPYEIEITDPTIVRVEDSAKLSSILPETSSPRYSSTLYRDETRDASSIAAEYSSTSWTIIATPSAQERSPEPRDQSGIFQSSSSVDVTTERTEFVDETRNLPTTSSLEESPGTIRVPSTSVGTDFSSGIIEDLSTRMIATAPSTRITESSMSADTIPEYPVTQSTRRNCSREECLATNCEDKNTSRCECETREKCQDASGIVNAAFNGKSYLRQQVNIDADGSLRIFVRLKTRSKSGVLVHAFFDPERYVLLYMEGGQLKFQFSCGLQTMLLGEIDSPINNGYDVDVEMRFQYLIGTDDIGKCSARLLVNDTVAMSGEQILSSHETIPRQVRIHLGGIPQAFLHYFPRIAMGFIGCMSVLRVNNVPRHFVRDSTETYQIEECTSFLCLLNPCRNFGSCHDIDGQVYCKCIAGYSGAVCERSACDDNPCYLGATCISSPGTGFICVCPLGMHGLLCEEESPIVQPSFSVFIPGFSSYAAYGLTNAVKDAMELRMRLMPQSLDQISLIAFMGQSGSSRDVTDHFSLTYVRGYIMLTWDLGSGVRRIFTKTPLRTRAYRPHTLRVGRRGRDAWLSVDDHDNVTGQAAGTMQRLDVSPILYVGGHKSRNFADLPHDLPLHTGFHGCIYDIELRTDGSVSRVTETSPATGRGVGECHRNECSQNACKNGALCLNHGPTYSCVCMKEWEGADCSVPAVTCSSLSPYKCQKADT